MYPGILTNTIQKSRNADGGGELKISILAISDVFSLPIGRAGTVESSGVSWPLLYHWFDPEINVMVPEGGDLKDMMVYGGHYMSFMKMSWFQSFEYF